MQNPEVWSFKEPESIFQVIEYNDPNVLPVKNLNNFFFNHLVSVVLPDSLRVPQNLVEVLSNDCEYYKILDVNLSALINTSFLDNFVRQGNLVVLSIDSRIDCDNCVAITPTGVLVLTLTKDTYQSLGLEGQVSHFSKKLKDRYIVKIDLKDQILQPGKAYYKKIAKSLDSLETFTLIVSWKPPEESVCPSSIAKYFDTLGYTTNVCEPKFHSHVVYSAKTPMLSEGKINEDDLIDFVEWLGMVSVDGDFNGDLENYVNTYETPEPNTEIGQIRFLQWRGLYQPNQIIKLMDFLEKFNNLEQNIWLGMYVQGFSDAPVMESNEEHHYFTNGDNGYLLIFNKSRYWYCTQRCSKKRYK